MDTTTASHPLGLLLAPPAYAAALALWPLTVLWAHWHRDWADALDDALDDAHRAVRREPRESPRPHRSHP